VKGRVYWHANLISCRPHGCFGLVYSNHAGVWGDGPLGPSAQRIVEAGTVAATCDGGKGEVSGHALRLLEYAGRGLRGS
jgi:hypothetical protein